MEQAKKKINLRVLNRYDDKIISIIETIPHVVLYDFNVNWQKKGIEGTLFLYLRSQEPKYGFCVLNRNNLGNLIVSVTSDLQIQQSGEYLMYKSNQTVNGLWIFGDENRLRLFNSLQDCISKSQQKITFQEIWDSLETMAPLPNVILSEPEFLARFQILAQNPFFAKAMYAGYLASKEIK